MFGVFFGKKDPWKEWKWKVPLEDPRGFHDLLSPGGARRQQKPGQLKLDKVHTELFVGESSRFKKKTWDTSQVFLK